MTTTLTPRDMGTGGGEFLLTIEHPYPNTSVTESYLPNVDLCKKKLGGLGIDVRQVIDDSNLPFENESFDIIINRHESYDIREVFRVLKRNGIFITQQVGAMNNLEFSNSLLDDNRIKNLDYSFEVQVENAKDTGFEVLEAEEYFPFLKFFDVGALVYFTRIIEWEFPGFSVERCFEKLLGLQSMVESNGFVESVEHRFLIVAQK
jgi:SAM-dependent methyltransferase